MGILVCFVMTLYWFDSGSVDFLACSSTSFKNQLKYYNKYFLKTVQSRLLEVTVYVLHRIETHLWRIHLLRCHLQCRKLSWVFCIHTPQQRSVNQQKQYYCMEHLMLFMSKQVSQPKISSNRREMKINPKGDIQSCIMPF